MKPLYTLPEHHFKVGEDLEEKLRTADNEPSRQILSHCDRRMEKFRKAVDEYNPEVIFLEGDDDFKNILDKLDYDGEVVFLDKDIEEYHSIVEKIEEVQRKYQPKMNEIWERTQEIRESETKSDYRKEAKDLARLFTEESEDLGELIESYKKEVGVLREGKWSDLIAEKYREPSLLNCGFHHLNKDFKRVGRMSYYSFMGGDGNEDLPERNFYSDSLMITKSLLKSFFSKFFSSDDIGYLPEKLKSRDIDVFVVDFLK